MSFSGSLKKVSTSLLECHSLSVAVVGVVSMTLSGSPGSSGYKNGALFNKIQQGVFLGNNLLGFLYLVI